MFQLKDYQKTTLEILEEFLKQARLFGAQNVFKDICTVKNMEYKPINTLENVPYICLRLPTGGGKTYLSAHSISVASKNYLEKEYPTVLWLTPTKTIKEQTVETLKNPRHPNRELLDSTFNGNVAIFDISDFANVRVQDIQNKACIFVSTIQNFRIEDKEGRKIYAHNENLEPHFRGIIDNPALKLDKVEEGTDKGKIKCSFANLLNILNPLVIVDEAHNNTTDLSYEVMNRVNPACIIEFTATPSKESNVLHRVSAIELKNEDMIKLPIMLTEYPSWQESLEACIIKRKGLEDIAKLDKDYIRPIVLIQAENKDKEVTVDVIKNYLIENGNIAPEKIAIATGEQRELDGINLFDPNCPIEFVITIQALKEGWDCSFAYIFCSVATVNSKTAVEQLLGRVLRMPYAEKREKAELNKAYAFVSTTSWPNAVAKLCDNLTNMGFEETEAEDSVQPQQKTLELETQEIEPIKQTFITKIDTTKLTEEEKQTLEVETSENGISTIKVDYNTPQEVIEKVEKIIDKKDVVAFRRTVAVVKNQVVKLAPADKGEVIEVPQLKLFIDDEWQEVDKELFLPNGWNLLDYPASFDDGEFDIKDDGRTVEIDIDGKKITERYYQNTLPIDLENIETSWSNLDLSRWLDGKMYQPDITMPVKLEFIRRIVEFLNLRKGISLSTLIMRKFLLLKAIEDKINKYRKQAYEKGYQQTLFSGVIPVETSFDFSYKFGQYYPVDKKYNGRIKFNKHFYSCVGAFDSAEEEVCAREIDCLPEVKYWVRNVDRHPNSYRFQTSTDYFYPDFIMQLNDGRLYIVEYKGAGFYSMDDSKEKNNIGKLWQEKSNGKCLFKMVSDEKYIGKSIKAQILEEI